jgi:UDP-N-acetylmuramate dehydrogenase
VVVARDGVASALAWIREEGLARTVLGSGSRVVAREGGLAGAVLRLGPAFATIAERDDGSIEVGAATPLALVARRLGWDALRFAPGTLGASLACDPGWAPFVAQVRVVGRGAEKSVPLDQALPVGSAVITGATLRPARARPPTLRPVHGAWVVPGGDEPDDVLREAGLAGTRLRGILAPEAAPSMLVNLGGGEVRDLVLLQRTIAERVASSRGVDLVDRFQWLGRAS